MASHTRGGLLGGLGGIALGGVAGRRAGPYIHMIYMYAHTHIIYMCESTHKKYIYMSLEAPNTMPKVTSY